MSIIYGDVTECGSITILHIYANISDILFNVHPVCKDAATVAAMKLDHPIAPDVGIGRT
jgi:hypothetical protein